MSSLRDLAASALHEVCDPCSIAANAPVSIVDMGLVRGVDIDQEGNVVVMMALTSASCTMSHNMARAAEEQLLKLPGIRSARVEVDHGYFWTVESMTDRGRAILDERRRRSLALAKLAPQQWRKSKAAATLPEPSAPSLSGPV